VQDSFIAVFDMDNGHPGALEEMMQRVAAADVIPGFTKHPECNMLLLSLHLVDFINNNSITFASYK